MGGALDQVMGGVRASPLSMPVTVEVSASRLSAPMAIVMIIARSYDFILWICIIINHYNVESQRRSVGCSA